MIHDLKDLDIGHQRFRGEDGQVSVATTWVLGFLLPFTRKRWSVQCMIVRVIPESEFQQQRERRDLQ